MFHTLAPLLSLLSSGIFLWLGHGLLLTYLPIAASNLGFNEWQTGLTGSFYFLGFVSGCLLTPRVLLRVGHIRGFAILASLYTAIVLLLGMVYSLWGWLFLRFFIGASISGLYMIFESWLNERSHFSNRGGVLAVYSMLNLGMVAAGQQLLHLPVDDPARYYMIAAILLTLSIIPVSLTQTMAPSLQQRIRLNLPKVWRHSHVGLMGAVVAGLVTGAYWAMAPVYGEAVGMSRSHIAWFMSASVLGGAIFQFPLGRLSDRMDRRIVLQCQALVAALFCVLLFFATRHLALGPALFVLLAFLWGGTCLTMYAISLAHANDTAVAGEFVEISGSMLIVLGVSSALGAMLAAFTMNLLGPSGLYGFMFAILVLFAFAILLRRRSHALPDTSKTHDSFQPLPGMTTPAVYEIDPRYDSNSLHAEQLMDTAAAAPATRTNQDN